MAEISDKNKKMLANMAPNLIYAFIPESTLNYKNFGSYLTNISIKRTAQRKFIQATARAQLFANSEKFYDFTREQIEDVYGKSVEDVICYLAEHGSLPAVKYEKDFVAGLQSIGEFNALDAKIAMNTSFSRFKFKTAKLTDFNPQTGTMFINGKSCYKQPGFDNFGNEYLQWYSNIENGISGTLFKTESGLYTPIQMSNGETSVNPMTEKEVDPKTSNFWNNLNAALPAIQGVLATALNAVQTLKPVQMSPSQVGDGWVQPYNNRSNNMNTMLIAGALIGGTLLLTQNDKKKKINN